MAPQLDQVSERRPRAVSNLLYFFFLLFLPGPLSPRAFVWGCLSSDTGGQRSLVHGSHPAPSPQCTVTMIHHSRGSLSLGPDTAVIHTHVDTQSVARRQTHPFIAVEPLLTVSRLLKNHSAEQNLQQCLSTTTQSCGRSFVCCSM